MLEKSVIEHCSPTLASIKTEIFLHINMNLRKNYGKAWKALMNV